MTSEVLEKMGKLNMSSFQKEVVQNYGKPKILTYVYVYSVKEWRNN